MKKDLLLKSIMQQMNASSSDKKMKKKIFRRWPRF